MNTYTNRELLEDKVTYHSAFIYRVSLVNSPVPILSSTHRLHVQLEIPSRPAKSHVVFLQTTNATSNKFLKYCTYVRDRYIIFHISIGSKINKSKLSLNIWNVRKRAILHRLVLRITDNTRSKFHEDSERRPPGCYPECKDKLKAEIL